MADTLEWIWLQRVSHLFWRAHSILVDDEHVELQGATRSSSTGRYVTVHLVAQRVRVPVQRTPEPPPTPLAPVIHIPRQRRPVD